MTTPLILRALAGEETPRRPLWLMRQAGRFLPEYRALRKEHSFEDLCRDPSLAADVTLMPLRRYPFDGAILFADLMTPLASMGVGFRFDPGPVLEKPLKTEADIDGLRRPPREEIAPEVMETVRRVRKDLPEGRALLGFGGAPWTLAAYLIQGQGKSDFPALRAMMASRPDLLGKLLYTLSEHVAEYLKSMVEAGAQAVQVFDSWAGLLSLRDFDLHVRGPLTALLEELKSCGVPRIMFAQGAPHLVEAYASLPCEAVSACWRTDLPGLREKLGTTRALQGNLDPALLLADPETVTRTVNEFLARMPRRGHVMNLGHGILPQTPLESVQALVDAVHAEKDS